MERIAEPWIISSLKKLRDAKRVVLVGSGKGGVGKSLLSAGLALSLSEKGYRVGLFDLDIHGPTSHIILGIEKPKLKSSKKGLEPLQYDNIKVMSIAFLIGDNPLPVFGSAKSSVISDLISNTAWGALDYLIVDLPPGTGDEVVLALRVFRQTNHGFAVVATPSVLSISVVERLVELLRDEKINILGLIENMATLPGGAPHPGDKVLAEFLAKNNLRLLGKMPFIPELEEYLLERRKPTGLEEFRRALWNIAEEIIRFF